LLQFNVFAGIYSTIPTNLPALPFEVLSYVILGMHQPKIIRDLLTPLNLLFAGFIHLPRGERGVARVLK